jgi:hypothetical protein
MRLTLNLLPGGGFPTGTAKIQFARYTNRLHPTRGPRALYTNNCTTSGGFFQQKGLKLLKQGAPSHRSSKRASALKASNRETGYQ